MRNFVPERQPSITGANLARWILPTVIGGLLVVTLYFLEGIRSRLSPSSDYSITSYAPVISKISPAVVNISTENKSLGSGVIVDKQGHIVTNHHVIHNASLITITLTDGRKGIATLLGSDRESDIAILKISMDQLPAMPSQPVTSAKVGDIVLAIGNPYGVGQSVTQGIVSAIGRSNLGLATFEQYIQTDAAINPGNSGGALITAKGQLIGINSAFLSHADGAQGISFAIPISQINKVKKDIIENGEVLRGYLGVRLHQLNKEAASFFNLQHTNGLVVIDVEANSPAQRAGLKQGDIILRINGKPLKHYQDSLFTIADMRPGHRISLDLYRSGKLVELTAELATRSPTKGVATFH